MWADRGFRFLRPFPRVEKAKSASSCVNVECSRTGAFLFLGAVPLYVGCVTRSWFEAGGEMRKSSLGSKTLFFFSGCFC